MSEIFLWNNYDYKQNVYMTHYLNNLHYVRS